MTPDEIATRGREIGRARWGKPLPRKAIELLLLYAQQTSEQETEQKAAS